MGTIVHIAIDGRFSRTLDIDKKIAQLVLELRCFPGYHFHERYSYLKSSSAVDGEINYFCISTNSRYMERILERRIARAFIEFEGVRSVVVAQVQAEIILENMNCYAAPETTEAEIKEHLNAFTEGLKAQIEDARSHAIWTTIPSKKKETTS
jgi:hypothetical protein